jgi:hypothetical protein
MLCKKVARGIECTKMKQYLLSQPDMLSLRNFSSLAPVIGLPEKNLTYHMCRAEGTNEGLGQLEHCSIFSDQLGPEQGVNFTLV